MDTDTRKRMNQKPITEMGLVHGHFNEAEKTITRVKRRTKLIRR